MHSIGRDILWTGVFPILYFSDKYYALFFHQQWVPFTVLCIFMKTQPDVLHESGHFFQEHFGLTETYFMLLNVENFSASAGFQRFLKD